MTNPGHIDPGYSGGLQFTVINMGREDYVLRTKDLIVTVLIFKLDTASIADYSVRHPIPVVAKIDQSELDRLSPDFIDVQKRATSIAKRTLGIATVGASILTVLLSLLVNAIEKRVDGVDELKNRVTQVEDQNASLSKELSDTRDQLKSQMDLERRIILLESKKTVGTSK